MNPAPQTKRRTLYLMAALVGTGLVLALLRYSGRSLGAILPSVTAQVESLGLLAPLGYILVYALAEVAFVPGSLMTLTAGALFGVVGGTAVAFVGATLGATAAFLISRHLLRQRVERWVRSSPRLAALDHAVEQDGRKLVLLVRLTPLIPFNALNYALGVTRVRFRDYLIGSVGILPGTVLYAYYGHVAGDVARIAAGTAPPHGVGYYVLLGVGLVATIVLTLVIARLARRALSLANLGTAP